MLITSLDNRKVKEWTKLHQKKYRQDEYLLLYEDLVKSAYDNGYLKTLVYVDKPPFEFANSYEVSREVLDKIAKKEGLTCIGIGRHIDQKRSSSKRVIILDHLQDPLNIGRIMESAALFGFDDVILSTQSADIYHDKCLKASKGAIYSLNISIHDLTSIIPILKEEGYEVLATGLKAHSKELYEVETAEKMAIILGNEGSGVREEVMAISDEVVKIDMHNIDSLNVAMAGAILMHRFKKI